MGEGLPGKTLKTYEAHLCKNVNELSDNGLMAQLTAAYSCLVICLRSTHTGDVDYAFEFLWAPRLHHSILLESLLITLKRCLPSFKFPSGAQLGDKLHLEDVGNSTASGAGFVESNRLPQIPKALEQGRKLVTEGHVSLLAQDDNKQQIGRSMNEAARNLNVFSSALKRKSSNVVGISKWQGRKFVKRKLGDSWESLEDNTACQEQAASSFSVNGEQVMIVKLECGDRRTLWYLPFCTKYADFRKNVDEKYELGPGSYLLEYLFDERLGRAGK